MRRKLILLPISITGQFLQVHYIALHADKIYMSPNGKIGAAQVIDGAGNAVENKAHSFWVKEMKARQNHLVVTPSMRLQWLNDSTDLSQYQAGVGKLLTLTASEAAEPKSDIVKAPFHLSKKFLRLNGLENAEIVETNVTFTEGIARFVTHPVVVPILLSIAGLGLVVGAIFPRLRRTGNNGAFSIAAVLFRTSHCGACRI